MLDVRESQNRLGRAAGYSGRGGDEDADDGEGIGGGGRGRGGVRSAADQRTRQEQRKRYQFEATASDDEIEDELDDNLDEITRVSKSLKAIALAAGEELDRQNDRIDNIANKTTKLNSRVDTTTNRVCLCLYSLRCMFSSHCRFSLKKSIDVWSFAKADLDRQFLVTFFMDKFILYNFRYLL